MTMHHDHAIGDAHFAATVLRSFPAGNVDHDSIAPVLLTIGRTTFGAAGYHVPRPSADELRNHRRIMRYYVIGELPASYRHRKADCYVAAIDREQSGTDWLPAMTRYMVAGHGEQAIGPEAPHAYWLMFPSSWPAIFYPHRVGTVDFYAIGDTPHARQAL